MNKSDAVCQVVEAQLAAYVDRELPAAEAVAVQRHLEGCEACRRLAAQQQSIRTLLRVRRSGLRESPPPLLEERVRERLDLADARRRRVWGAGAAAFALLVLSLGLGVFYLRTGRPDQVMVAETVNDHIRYLLDPGTGLNIATSDPQTLLRWFQGRLDIGVSVPAFERAGLQLQGGRVCYLLDRHVAYLRYEKGDNRYSLFIMNRTGIHFPQGEEVSLEGHRICLTSYKGYSLVAWEARGLLYALVANCPSEHLAEIAATSLRG